MKQSAIEWLFQKLWDEPKDKLTWYSILNKATEMHKQEMVSFGYDCIKEVVDSSGELIYNKVPEEVYQETFKKD